MRQYIDLLENAQILVEAENLNEKDLKRFLMAAGAAGLIAGSSVAAFKVGQAHGADIQGTEWTSEDEPYEFGEGDWGAPLTGTANPQGEVVQNAAGRGGPSVKHQVAALAATIWGEARSEGETGMLAVGHVIANRAQDHRWGTTISEVVHRRKQFSCWNPGDPNRAKIDRMVAIDRYMRKKPDGYEKWLTKFQGTSEYPEYVKWLKAKQIARQIISGQSSDMTGGALFYHTTAIMPYWAPTMTKIKTLGNHIFYTDR